MIWQKMHAGITIRVGRVGSIKSLINQSELSCAILYCLLSSAYKYWIFVSIVSLTQGCLNAKIFSLCIFYKHNRKKKLFFTHSYDRSKTWLWCHSKMWFKKQKAIKTYLSEIVKKLKYMIRKIATNITRLISS